MMGRESEKVLEITEKLSDEDALMVLFAVAKARDFFVVQALEEQAFEVQHVLDNLPGRLTREHIRRAFREEWDCRAEDEAWLIAAPMTWLPDLRLRAAA